MMSPGSGSVSSSARIRLDNLTVQDSKSMDSKDDDVSSDGKKKSAAPQVEASTSPTNNRADTAKTPISKNTKIKMDADNSGAFDFAPDAKEKEQDISGDSSAGADAKQQDDHAQAKDASNISSAFRKGSIATAGSVMKTPSLYSKTDSFSFDFNDMIRDDPLLNSQLRGQSFTPLPHNGSGIKGISNQLSWSISPHLGDIADWADADIKTGKAAGGPVQPSLSTDDGKPKGEGADVSTENISPMAINAQMDTGAFAPSLSFWQDEDVAAAIGEGKDQEKTAPLPMFYDPSMPPPSKISDDKASHIKPVPSQQPLGTSTPRHPMHHAEQRGPGYHQHPRGGSQQIRDAPPQIMPSPRYNYMSTPGSYGPHGDRVRNLRGRLAEGAPHTHMPPPPPSSYYYHHNLTSPMVGGAMMKPGMWGSPHVAHRPHPMASPPHRRPIRPLDLTPSKRKCVPLKPPLPSKFQGDVEKAKATPMPEFTNLVNFPAHISQKQPITLPDGMRCCVMCGQACQCNGAMKGTKKIPPQGVMKGGPAPGMPPVPAAGYAIIPTQNKGLCTACDVNVWVVVQSGLEIKWCKGCKNFRPWASFGDKGLATKCVRCRERQREKYALQKEAKEKKKSALKGV